MRVLSALCQMPIPGQGPLLKHKQSQYDHALDPIVFQALTSINVCRNTTRWSDNTGHR